VLRFEAVIALHVQVVIIGLDVQETYAQDRPTNIMETLVPVTRIARSLWSAIYTPLMGTYVCI